MTAAVVAAHGATSPAQATALVAMVAVLVGSFSLLAGIARLGFISAFLSRPVVTGYVTGLALTIIARQVPKLLGLHVPSYANFFRPVWSDLTHLSDTSLRDRARERRRPDAAVRHAALAQGARRRSPCSCSASPPRRSFT